MINEIAKICVNCEFSEVLRGKDYCVCNRKKPILVRSDGSCKRFVVDLLKYEMPVMPEITLDNIDIDVEE